MDLRCINSCRFKRYIDYFGTKMASKENVMDKRLHISPLNTILIYIFSSYATMLKKL